jgi:hypothetical protein
MMLTSATKESHFFFRSFGLLHCRKECRVAVGRLLEEFVRENV